MNRRRLVAFPLIIAVVVVIFQYCGAERFVNPETGKVARVGLRLDQEAALGLQSYEEVLRSAEVVKAGPEVELVRRVAQRLVNVVRDEARSFDWQISVVRSSQVNAFCLPGGKIVVLTGILSVAQNEAGLATVMGHEMAHATSRHGSQRLLQTQLAQTIMQGVGTSVALGDMDPREKQAVLGAFGAGAQVGFLLPFSREHETEADAIGLLYMARAGYDPEEAVQFWQRMSQVGGPQTPQFMSTHPAHGTRIQRLQELLPRAREEYQRAQADKTLPAR